MEKFLNISCGVIGRTVTTKNEPNTSSQFQFWVSNNENAYGNIEIGNIVAAYSDKKDDITFGIVEQMRSYSDVDSFIADYLSHNFGEAEIEIPTEISEVIVVTCSAMRNLSNKTKPVERSKVYYPSEEGIKYAYGIIDKDGNYCYSGAAILLGIFENGDGTKASIAIDECFLLGPDGAHLNVSGISGLASKTSAIQFLIKSLITYKSKKVGFVTFNIKSKDLLFLDKHNPRLDDGSDLCKWSLDAYESLKIPSEPFDDIEIYAPADIKNNPNGVQSLRNENVYRFIWNLSMIYQDIPSLFNPMDWDDRTEGAWFVIQKEIEGNRIRTYSEVITWLDRLINSAGNNQWPHGVHIATWNKMRFHIKRFPQTYKGLISTLTEGNDIPWDNLSDGKVFVIDIQKLDDRGQRLVFNRVVRKISGILESKSNNLDAIVVFVDELNKFAPSSSYRTPLKERLIDITARGRGIGLVLFGAEQFASSVEKEIIENCSTYLFGRTESNELRTPTYSSLTNEVKTKLTTLPQGTLLAKFAKFPQPIFIRFPLPPCLSGDDTSTD